MTYILLIFLSSEIDKKIGRLGKLKFKRGYYLYVGSARKNFKQRIKRHLSRKKKIFWHIDYLLSDERASVKKAFYADSDIEHEVAKQLEKEFEVIKKFGSSDCKCVGHLFYGGRGIDRLKKIIITMELFELNLLRIE